MSNQFSVPGKASMIIDGQFGSTGKGVIAAYLAERNQFAVATTNASANAGHTTRRGDEEFVTFHMPTTAVIQKDCIAYLNAGAIIDPEVFLKEVEQFDMADRVKIHPHAAVILPEHRESEKLNDSSATKIGSTQKGVGAALADKLMRRGNVAKNHEILRRYVDPQFHLSEILLNGGPVMVEVPQGFSLGVNSGFYPFTTSREVSVAQALSDAGLSPQFLGPVMMTARTYPIRVGNIRDENGDEIGNSGPGYPDQFETSWKDIDQPEERTTVTKRVRRVFDWSPQQWVHATQVIRPTHVFLNFVNYMKGAGELLKLIKQSGEMWRCPLGPDYAVPFTHFGIGPDVADVFETADDVITKMAERGLWK